MSLSIPFRPRILETLTNYSRAQFRRDFIAGLNVMVMAFPLSVAFAIASGAKPEQGLFTAILGGMLIAAFGGSNVQIGGPTGAFVVITYGILQRFGADGLAICTALSGGMLCLMAFARFGSVIRFIPYPVSRAFTKGIAVLILSSQIRNFLGLDVDKLDDELKRARQEPDVLILRVRKVLAMDATGLQALEDLHAKLRAKNKHLILSAGIRFGDGR